jgi:hypothetical protein
MMSFRFAPVLLPLAAFGSSLAVGVACKSIQPNPDHCANQTGDSWCLDKYPDGTRPYCYDGPCASHLHDGCGMDAPEPGDACYLPCGDVGLGCPGETDTESDTVADASTTASTTVTTSTTMDPDSTTGTSDTTETSGGCVGNEDCGGDAPFCVDEICVGCDVTEDGDAACAEGFPDTPVCAGGVCVECSEENPGACAGSTPICDVGANSCVGCSFHDQCPGSACSIANGECFSADAADIYEVPVEHATIQEAVDAIEAAGTIRVSGTGIVNANISVSGDKSIAILGVDAGPEIHGATIPTFLVEGAGTRLYLQGVRIALNGQSSGIEADGATVYLDETEVVQNTGGGITLTGGASLFSRNTMIGRNGDTFDSTRGILANASSFEILYSSVVANDGDTGSSSIECSGAGSRVIRNSIVTDGAPGGSIACSGVDVSYSSIDTAGIGGEGTVVNDDPIGDWFVSIAGGNFRLEAGHPFDGIAEWQAGDPPWDIDLDDRPTTDGSPDVAGADVP